MLAEHWLGPRRWSRDGGRWPNQIVASGNSDVERFAADGAAEYKAEQIGDPRRHADKIAENDCADVANCREACRPAIVF
jgi:hypothetical protein